ncbi:4-coumarate--CoA ligase-like 9 [Olea europaea var. sylvestris]|uniref:4-coumarate--CoA ligase-like 9 n=1 Tax=Olea europaea var. sylvestris TaxID=158386 RepID=UPI000C1CEDE6|nr:4-coumarate--CoA ligase-like 9 [Olea europaea var. sylvestris]
MAETQGRLNKKTVDPKNGYCPQTKIYHSLRSSVPLPPPSQPLSVVSYALSLLHSTTTSATLSSTAFLIDAVTGHRLTYTAFLEQIHSLSFSIHSLYPSLSKNDVVFIVAPPSLNIPVVYFSLLSLGATVSPANPISSSAELNHQIELSKPVLAFATSSTSHKLPSHLPVILLDSPHFHSMLSAAPGIKIELREIHQSDSAAILYSSGTTGKVKGVVLTHRNLIAMIAGLYYNKSARDEQEINPHPVSLFTLPLFHVFGFFMLIRAASMGESLVLMGKFDFVKMLEAVDKFKVTYIPVAPPLVVAMSKSDLVMKYDLSSLQTLGCGGAPLGKEVSERFKARFPNIEIIQGYGLTESCGGATRMIGPDETNRHGSAGRLSENTEAKVVDPVSGDGMPPGQRGEIWLRGPTIMKGYAGDEAATAATLDSEGWLKTGDLGYFDSDGFLFIVDRLKELIKYKAYQVPPAELEHLLQSIPEIVDAAVIPYQYEQNTMLSLNLCLTCDASLQVAPYKKIRRVAFIDSIPKSPAGKVLRRELVNHALSVVSSKL